MIKPIIFSLAAVLSLPVVLLSAQGENAPKAPPTSEKCDTLPPPPPHMKKISKEELQMLKTLFAMSNKELARLRGMIAHLEQIPEAKRKKMAEDLERATSEDPAKRQKFMQEMRTRFEARRKNLLARYYATLPKEQAQAEAEAFLKMSKHEQMKYIEGVRQKLGLPVQPRRGKMHGHPAQGPRENGKPNR